MSPCPFPTTITITPQAFLPYLNNISLTRHSAWCTVSGNSLTRYSDFYSPVYKDITCIFILCGPLCFYSPSQNFIHPQGSIWTTLRSLVLDIPFLATSLHNPAIPVHLPIQTLCGPLYFYSSCHNCIHPLGSIWTSRLVIDHMEF